jgi:hypothetical protein
MIFLQFNAPPSASTAPPSRSRSRLISSLILTQSNDDWNNKLPLNGMVLGEVNPGKPDLRYTPFNRLMAHLNRGVRAAHHLQNGVPRSIRGREMWLRSSFFESQCWNVNFARPVAVSFHFISPVRVPAFLKYHSQPGPKCRSGSTTSAQSNHIVPTGDYQQS